MTSPRLALLLLLALPGLARAAEEAPFTRASQRVQADLQAAMAELSELRAAIAAEKLPMSRELSRLERELSQARERAEEAGRTLDERNLELSNLQAEIEGRGNETAYLSNLLDEYVRNLETRIHVAELQRYEGVIEEARLATEDPDLGGGETFRRQAAAVDASLERLLELVGGTRFPGRAVDENGRLHEVTFAMLGPVALYSRRDGSGSGLAEQVLGSLEPNMIPLADEEMQPAAAALIATGAGELPFDASLGNARKIEATKETLVDQARKGGPVMVPILLLAACSFLVAIGKWIQLSLVREPARKKIDRVLESLRAGRDDEARTRAEKLRGPAGDMLRAALEHLHEPKALIEEVMYESALAARLRLQGWLPFIAVSAAAAPLLGLLGTVTGIINTFKLITVFGTGDARTLSSGISEALITTEFGLIVAIPSLLLHAWLSRKAQRLLDHVEKTAVSFLNRLPEAALEPAGTGEGREVAPEKDPVEPERPEAGEQARAAEEGEQA